MLKFALAAAAAVTLATAAVADEVWQTEIGDVIYETEKGDFAVLSFPIGDTGTRGNGFIEGLAGNYTDRGHFTGYWSEPSIEEDGAGCPVTIVDDNGLKTNNWGRLDMVFLDKGFPSSWVVMRGACFETPSQYLIGTPVVAPGVR